MELLLTVVFLLTIGIVLLYYSFKEINWYFNKEQQKESFRLYIKKSLLGRDYQVISMREPDKLEDNRNPFKGEGIRVVLPAFFGAGERSFYWIIDCKDTYGREKEIWAEVTQSIFMKPKYKFSLILQ